MTPYQRREILIQEMDHLHSKEISCKSCAGFCCTYERNSMQITETEAEDIFGYLSENNLLNETLVLGLEENIKKFRLDQKLGNGKKSFIRRTYTCPFFTDQKLGCSLPKEVKPYGCLAYNPSAENEEQGMSCSSNQEQLLQREKNFPNPGEKQTIPEALLKLVYRLRS